jgi:hypothetical protein
MKEFVPFPKIGRLSRSCTITEKIDGTNACIYIGESLLEVHTPEQEQEFLVGSRTRWITPGKNTDNYNFAAWAYEHKEELIAGLGPGLHFGEWWGLGIQRRYGATEKHFSLFQSDRWSDERGLRPKCCDVVPVIYQGLFTSTAVDEAIESLKIKGSFASPGFMDPEGVVVFHHATKQMFKKTIVGDEKPKGSKEE